MADSRAHLTGPGQGQQPPYVQQQQPQWSNTPIHAPRPAAPAATPSAQRSSRTRATRQPATPQPQTPQMPPVQAPAPAAVPPVRGPAMTPTSQALHSTYASRMRTGATLLMQPMLPIGGGAAGGGGGGSGAAAATASTLTSTAVQQTPAGRTSGRRGAGAVNYADPGSGDEFPDAGEGIDSDDSDFVASGGVRQSIRTAQKSRFGGIAPAGTPRHVGSPAPGGAGRAGAAGTGGLDQSYLGKIPPSNLIVRKLVSPTKHDYFLEEPLLDQASRPASLVPIRVEFETDSHRIRDCFVWNVHEKLITPESFARVFCADLELNASFADTIAAQIRAQLEDHEAVATIDFGVDYSWMDPPEPDSALFDPTRPEFSEDGPAWGEGLEEIPECRIVVAIDVQIGTYHLLDHIEWDLLSPLTPEAFARTLCAELGLSGEAAPLIAHAVHEELLKHKKDAIEWGVLTAAGEHSIPTLSAEEIRDRSGLSVLKDKTGLGLGWGKAPKDGKGRGPKTLRSVWRDWAEAEEFAARFEVLTAEEVERREMERERASRRLRRETSKFQSSAGARRRR